MPKIKVKIFDEFSGKEIPLKRREGSDNYFLDPIYIQHDSRTYEICPRLDPAEGDITIAEPILDVDMWEMRFGHRRKKVKLSEQMHHTKKNPEGIYEWNFNDVVELKFSITVQDKSSNKRKSKRKKKEKNL